MAAVRVVTDSTAYLPPDLVAGLGVTLVSLYYEVGNGGSTRELDSGGDFGEFYAGLEAGGPLATTSAPSIEDFRAGYAPLLEDGGSVVSIHISSGLSETCSNARQAAKALAEEGSGGERVEVVDSASTAGHLGLVVIGAARLAGSGADHEAVLARVREARQEVKLWFLVDTLEYLQKGGRIGTATAWIGTALQVKPILTIESDITAVERVRTRARGLDRLVELMRHWRSIGADAYFVQHTRAQEDAERLARSLQEVFWRPPEFLSEIGPVVGTHTGPGLVGVGGCPSRLLDAA
jgi:fatty acid kinase fatty acid binding subunit